MMTAINASPMEAKPCIIGGARIDQSAIPIRALIPVSFTAHTQPKISTMPITADFERRAPAAEVVGKDANRRVGEEHRDKARNNQN